jgi:hypothetical protein
MTIERRREFTMLSALIFSLLAAVAAEAAAKTERSQHEQPPAAVAPLVAPITGT